MTELDYKLRLTVIEDEYLKAKKQLYIDYANAQRKYKVGDIIKNDTGAIIKIEKFGIYMSFKTPIPTYIGRELRKDLVPKKNCEIGVIYGNDGVELLNN